MIEAIRVLTGGLLQIALLFVLVVAGPVFCRGQENAGQTNESTRIWYRLVNVTIPADSPFRNDSTINKPPMLYVIVKKNGVQIGGSSTAHTGWSVDFARPDQGDDANTWPIRENGGDRYTIEVWDQKTLKYDHQIFNTTGVPGKAFRDLIYEQGSSLLTQDRLASIKFESVAAPKKYADKASPN